MFPFLCCSLQLVLSWWSFFIKILLWLLLEIFLRKSRPPLLSWQVATLGRWDKAHYSKSVHLCPCGVQGDKKALGNENTHFCGVGKLHNSGLGPVLPISIVWPQRRWPLVSPRWPLISLQWRQTCHDPYENMPPPRPLPITFPSQVVGQSSQLTWQVLCYKLRKEPHTARVNWGPLLQTGTLHSGFYLASYILKTCLHDWEC